MEQHTQEAADAASVAPDPGPRSHGSAAPFSLLTRLAADHQQLEIFSERQTAEGWLAAERPLAMAQADHGVIGEPKAAAVAAAATYANLVAGDPQLANLWAHARNVGYPIHGLVREIRRHLAE